MIIQVQILQIAIWRNSLSPIFPILFFHLSCSYEIPHFFVWLKIFIVFDQDFFPIRNSLRIFIYIVFLRWQPTLEFGLTNHHSRRNNVPMQILRFQWNTRKNHIFRKSPALGAASASSWSTSPRIGHVWLTVLLVYTFRRYPPSPACGTWHIIS